MDGPASAGKRTFVLHESGEDVHVAVWPTRHDLHQVASRQSEFEGRCFVLASGALMRASSLPPELEPHLDRVSGPDQWVVRGGRAITGPSCSISGRSAPADAMPARASEARRLRITRCDLFRAALIRYKARRLRPSTVA